MPGIPASDPTPLLNKWKEEILMDKVQQSHKPIGTLDHFIYKLLAEFSNNFSRFSPPSNVIKKRKQSLASPLITGSDKMPLS